MLRRNKKPRYTGTADGPTTAKRAGTEQWVKEVIALSEGALWNNGTFNKVRDIKGKPGQMSVHSTGRAADLSYRKMPNKGKPNGRAHALRVMRILTENSELVGLEAILDYFPKPHGRGWRCDRGTWSRYTKHTISGAPGGDWIHCEISPAFADDPKKVSRAFEKLRQKLGQSRAE